MLLFFTSHEQEQEMLGGLLARQVRLAAVISEEPVLWSVDLGRMMLRCIVGTHFSPVEPLYIHLSKWPFSPANAGPVRKPAEPPPGSPAARPDPYSPR